MTYLVQQLWQDQHGRHDDGMLVVRRGIDASNQVDQEKLEINASHV